MLNTTLTALLAAFFVVVFLAVGTAVYVGAGMPGMSAMHETALVEYKTDRVGNLVNDHRENMKR